MRRLLLTSSLLLSAMLVFVFSTQGLAATRPQASAEHAVGQGDGPGQDVVLRDLPNISSAQMAVAKQPPFPRNPNMSNAQYLAAKAAAAAHQGVVSRPQDAGHLLGAPRSQAAGLANTPFNVVDFLAQSQGCNGTLWTPSDMALAVSSSFILQVVNECLSVYTKTGGLLVGPKDLCGIFGLPANSGTAGCFDPRALYDAQANKFVIVASYQDPNGDGWILTGAATNPTGLWHTHKVSRGPALADFPTLGQTAFNNNASDSLITVCDNLFGNNGSFTDECLLFPKKGIYGTLGAFTVWFNFSLGGELQNSIQPANSYELSDNPRAQFAVNSVNDGGGLCTTGAESGLVVWAFSGSTGGQPRASGFFTGCGSTSNYSIPGSADNASFCNSCIETLDNRISGMVFYSQGVLFPTIDTNNGATSAVLGWRVHPYLDDNGLGCTGSVLCPALTDVILEQEFCYDCGAGNILEAYFGDIATDPENNWTMFATFSSRGDFFNISPGQFYASNRVSFLTPFHDSGIFSCVNNAAYGQFRWGDYSAAAPDDPGTNPKNVPATWGSGMYIQSNGLWGTCISGNHPQDGP